MSDLPERLDLRVGEVRTLQLPSLAQGGYRWELIAENERVVGITVQFQSAGAANAGTFSPFEIATLRGLQAGSTIVRCQQRRSWEGSAAPLIDQTVTVEVS